MIFFIYLVTVLIAIPVIGRYFAAGVRDGATPEVSPTSCAIIYGSFWPAFIVLVLCVLVWEHRPNGDWLRWLVTGTKEKF